MNRQEIVEWIDSLEDKYPVNEWTVNDVHVWPLLKIKIILSWNNNSTNKEKIAKVSLLKNAFKGCWEYIKLYKRKAGNRTNLYCLAPHFRYFHNGIYINRYYNDLIESDLNVKNFLLFDYGTVSDGYKRNVDFPEQTVFLGNIKYFALLVREFYWSIYSPKTQWSQFNYFIDEVKSVVKIDSISKKSIIKQYAYIDTLKKFYKPLLKRHKVDNIYTLCYYVSEMYAMNLAASELKINTCDIQHGGQGTFHLAYARFNKVPETGYKLLPGLFWCWDKSSAEAISAWSKKSQNHSVIVNGNPWLSYCNSNFNYQIRSDKKIILYTLQPIGDLIIDPYIIEAIQKTPENFEWWLRLHPRQHDLKSNIVNLLRNYDIIDKVELEQASNLPLPVILEKCFVHISKFSGSILEAYFLKRKSIIISVEGVKAYPEVIASEYGEAVLTENSDDLLKSLLDN